jgi:hypothetical protein
MQDTWADRDFPVLEYLVEKLDGPPDDPVTPAQIVADTEMSREDVDKALYALSTAEPRYFHANETAESWVPHSISSVTERARREVRAWPTPDVLVDRLVAALDRAADAEPDPEKQSRLRQLAVAFGGGMRDVAVQVAGTALARGAGF